jgi:hypothetical protein
LNEAISLKSLSPMKKIASAVNEGITRRKHRAVGSHISFHIERPGIGWYLADIQADADFACRPIAMAFQYIAVPVYSEKGIGRPKAKPRIFFEARTEIFKKALERRIAVSVQHIWHLIFVTAN